MQNIDIHLSIYIISYFQVSLKFSKTSEITFYVAFFLKTVLTLQNFNAINLCTHSYSFSGATKFLKNRKAKAFNRSFMIATCGFCLQEKELQNIPCSFKQ